MDPSQSLQPPAADAGQIVVELEPQEERTSEHVEAPPRQCGRCRVMFEGDATLFAPARPDWWVCPPCRAALFGGSPDTTEVPPRRWTGDAS